LTNNGYITDDDGQITWDTGFMDSQSKDHPLLLELNSLKSAVARFQVTNRNISILFHLPFYMFRMMHTPQRSNSNDTR
jgi:hypothetical protein